MTPHQVEAILSGFEQNYESSHDKSRRQQEWQRAQGWKDWKYLGCANAYMGETRVYSVSKGSLAHKDYADITYTFHFGSGERIADRVDHIFFHQSTSFGRFPQRSHLQTDYIVFDENSLEEAPAIRAAINAARGFVWLFTKDCSYDSSK